MQGYATTTTWDTTGIKTITPGFLAKFVEVKITPRGGSAFQGIQRGAGWTDLTRKNADWQYLNPADGVSESECSTTKLFRLRGQDATGNLITILEGVLDSTTATQVKFNVTSVDTDQAADFQISIKVLG